MAHIEYDPNRTARIALLHYADGEKRYILAPNKLNQGDRIENGPSADIKPGNSLPLCWQAMVGVEGGVTAPDCQERIDQWKSSPK